jgi:hypothetical protein
MAYEPKEGSGALFKSDKGENPNRPDYRGDIMLGGVLYEVSGWIKPKPSNPQEKFMSLSGKPKQAKQAAPVQKPKVDSFEDMQNDVPW